MIKCKGLQLMLVGLMALGALSFLGLAQEETPQFVIPENIPELRPPIVVTTCGQSPGALMVKVVCDTLGLPCIEEDLLTADKLEELCKGDNPPHVLFITTGTSLKGMGAAGVDIDYEVKRCLAVVEKARELGLVLIVGQIEGPSRRVDEYDEKSIRAMTPLADLLITREDVNEDGYFTKVAEENNIPQIFIKKSLDLQVLFPLIFKVEAETEG